MNVVDVKSRGRFTPAVSIALGAVLKVKLNVVYTCVKSNALEGELIVNAVKRSIALVRAATAENNRSGNLNLSAVDCKIKNSIDLQRLHHIAFVCVGAVCIYVIAVAAAHGDVTDSLGCGIKNESKRSFLALLNRSSEVTREGYGIIKHSDNAIDNRILGLGIGLTANDNAVLALKGLTNNYVAACALGAVLIISNGEVIGLTECNRSYSTGNGVLVSSKRSSVSVLVYSVNLKSRILNSISRLNDSTVNDYDGRNCAVVKGLGNAYLNIGSLDNLAVLEAYSSGGVSCCENLCSINGVLVSSKCLGRTVVVLCNYYHTCGIKGRARLVLNCIGINGDLYRLKNYGLKSDLHGSANVLVADGNSTTIGVEVCIGANREFIFLYRLAPGLLALLSVISGNDKVLGSCLCNIVCEISHAFLKLDGDGFKNRLFGSLLFFRILSFYFSKIFLVFIIRLQGNCNYDAGCNNKTEK